MDSEAGWRNRDEKGRPLDMFIVSGHASTVQDANAIRVVLTLVFRTGDDLRKMESHHLVYTDAEHRVDNPGEKYNKEFGPKWLAVRESILKLARGERMGKYFLRQAMEAYRVKEKLRPDQIAEAMAGAFLVEAVNQS